MSTVTPKLLALRTAASAEAMASHWALTQSNYYRILSISYDNILY